MNLINYAQLSLTELQLAHTASYFQGTRIVTFLYHFSTTNYKERVSKL